ncbi:MAG: NADH-quinone oxidoreductase subunit L [Eubacterium sp.]|nr:NADH-quinone oxidoreductase subunit L [Eubacterium sp.]
MSVVFFLICFPVLMGLIVYMVKDDKTRNRCLYIGSGIIMAAVAVLVIQWAAGGGGRIVCYYDTEIVDHVILVVEIALMFFIIFKCAMYRKYWISLLSIFPTLLIAWFETNGPEMDRIGHIYVDHLSVLMCIIIGLIGGMIVIYSGGYMTHYHQHHKGIRERKNYFFMLLFIFLGAMFGFVLSSSLLWIDLFWEITSVCSFLLIGYTGLDEAINNSFRALWMNLLGGTALAIGIVYYGLKSGNVSLESLVSAGRVHTVYAVIPIALIAFAAMTKAAQLPFSTWLLGAMVAPTPSSALLHSATMVKAGIYVLIRLAPAMRGTMTGNMVAYIGGITFFTTSVMAMGHSDGKKVLACSTISNLGLMVACAGIGMPETIWAGVLLMLFHAISKSLLFQSVGATENAIGSRDIENMHGLMNRLPKLAVLMFIGIAGMFLAPFGMLISKWSALKASIDSHNILMVLFIAFGSATTSFYWSKWMGKLISKSHATGKREQDITRTDENVSLITHAILMIGVCALLPLISKTYVDPLLKELFGYYQDVLPLSIMIMMVIIICFIFAIPFLAYLYSKRVRTNVKLSYMSGINTGNNTGFVDSFGKEKALWLSNYYFTDKFDPDRLLFYCQVFAMALLIIMLCLIGGGAIR